MPENGIGPFEGYRVYGPILHKKEGRNFICIVSLNDPKNRTTITYGKYLLSLKIGRWLKKEEEVDHIDGDKLNDSIDNLQILSKLENIRKSHPGSQCPSWRCKCENCIHIKRDYMRKYMRKRRASK